jgi:hypothetical protein
LLVGTYFAKDLLAAHYVSEGKPKPAVLPEKRHAAIGRGCSSSLVSHGVADGTKLVGPYFMHSRNDGKAQSALTG